MKHRILIPFICLMLAVLACVPASCGTENGQLVRTPEEMVTRDLMARNITDTDVLRAMRSVPRHRFVPPAQRPYAYTDSPLPIGHGQTISQPYIVALMTQSLDLDNKDRVLEIGTGSGYQAAVLAEIAGEVYSIEIVPQLAEKASALLSSLGYNNVTVTAGDGFSGWPEHAPYDAVILTCAVKPIPEPLIRQLRQGGRIILPLGKQYQTQQLILGTKKNGGLIKESILPVRFVPMTGKALEQMKSR